MPCYIVKDKLAKDGEPKDRLVEANNQASARNFVVRDRFTVEQAKPAEIAQLVKGGAAYEVATGADEVQEQQEPGDNADEVRPDDADEVPLKATEEKPKK